MGLITWLHAVGRCFCLLWISTKIGGARAHLLNLVMLVLDDVKERRSD